MNHLQRRLGRKVFWVVGTCHVLKHCPMRTAESLHVIAGENVFVGAHLHPFLVCTYWRNVESVSHVPKSDVFWNINTSLYTNQVGAYTVKSLARFRDPAYFVPHTSGHFRKRQRKSHAGITVVPQILGEQNTVTSHMRNQVWLHVPILYYC